jgi:hypothetical protein
MPTGTEHRNHECRIGLNAEFLDAEFSNAECDLMPKFRMPTWTECRTGLNAELD